MTESIKRGQDVVILRANGGRVTVLPGRTSDHSPHEGDQYIEVFPTKETLPLDETNYYGNYAEIEWGVEELVLPVLMMGQGLDHEFDVPTVSDNRESVVVADDAIIVAEDGRLVPCPHRDREIMPRGEAEERSTAWSVLGLDGMLEGFKRETTTRTETEGSVLHCPTCGQTLAEVE